MSLISTVCIKRKCLFHCWKWLKSPPLPNIGGIFRQTLGFCIKYYPSFTNYRLNQTQGSPRALQPKGFSVDAHCFCILCPIVDHQLLAWIHVTFEDEEEFAVTLHYNNRFLRRGSRTVQPTYPIAHADVSSVHIVIDRPTGSASDHLKIKARYFRDR